MRKYRVEQYRQTLAKEGELATSQIPFVKGSPVDLEFRSYDGVVVSLLQLNADGEVLLDLYWDSGPKVHLQGHFEGFTLIQVRHRGSFVVSGYVNRQWFEENDGKPVSVPVEMNDKDTARAAMRAEIRAAIVKERLRGELSAEGIVELVEDYLSDDDHDFDFEQDSAIADFGKGFMEDEVPKDAPRRSSTPPVPKRGEAPLKAPSPPTDDQDEDTEVEAVQAPPKKAGRKAT